MLIAMGGLVDEYEVEEPRNQRQQTVDRVQVGHPEREIAMHRLKVERSNRSAWTPGDCARTAWLTALMTARCSRRACPSSNRSRIRERIRPAKVAWRARRSW